MNISIYPISAKPYHLGHHKTIQKAENENDVVILIVSLKDRDNIKGSHMAEIWKNHILPTYSDKIKPVFLMSSPVSHVYNILGNAETSMQENMYRIYGDENDIVKNYSNLEKYYPFLTQNGYVELMPSKREDIADISGTKMREYLKNQDFEGFKNGLPDILDKKAVYDILCQPAIKY